MYRDDIGMGCEPMLVRFSRSDRAVSPVISTILMVAITVVLAATAFVLVADVGSNVAETAPAIGLLSDDSTDQLQITTASQNANWNRIAVFVREDLGTDPVYVGNDAGPVNEPANNLGLLLTRGERVPVIEEPLQIFGADTLSFCRDGTNDGRFEVALYDKVANQIVGTTYVFESLRAC